MRWSRTCLPRSPASFMDADDMRIGTIAAAGCSRACQQSTPAWPGLAGKVD